MIQWFSLPFERERKKERKKERKNDRTKERKKERKKERMAQVCFAKLQLKTYAQTILVCVWVANYKLNTT